jgi:hypothetical protein
MGQIHGHIVDQRSGRISKGRRGDVMSMERKWSAMRAPVIGA